MAIIDYGGNTVFQGSSGGTSKPYPTGFYIGSSASIVPSTTHTQGGATPILTQQVTCATANAADAVLLPSAFAGCEIVVQNSSGSLAMQVYATGSNTINGTAGSTGVSQAASAVTIYYCFADGAWISK